MRNSWKESKKKKGIFNWEKMTVCGHCPTTEREGTMEIKIEIIDLTERNGASGNGSIPKQMLDEIRSATLGDIKFDGTCLSGATTMDDEEHLFELIISDITPDDCPY